MGGPLSLSKNQRQTMIQQSPLLSLYFTLLLSSATAPPFTAAQPTSTTHEDEDDSVDSASMAILVLVVVSALLFLGSFSLWIHNCCDSATPYSRSRSFRSVVFVGAGSRVRQRGHGRDSRSTRSTGGVDKALIDSFPTIAYSAAKEMKMGVGSLECAVCLSEFSGEELLRLLPSCDHVFHPDCIATWLANHATCPVCRARVVDNRKNPIKIDGIPMSTAINNPDPGQSAEVLNMDMENPASVSQPRGDSERFTLKLPEGVKEQMVKARLKLKRSASCEYLPVEGISRWIGRSERWGSSVVPSDRVAVKGDEAGDGSDPLPV